MARSEQRRNSDFAPLAGLAGILILLATAIAAQAQTLTVLYSFTNGDVGNTPASGLIMDQAGRLYGTASAGGAHGDGTVYLVSRAGSGWSALPLYSFQGGTDGAAPVASVAFGPDGTLYGTTPAGGLGGDGGYGTVFNLRPPPSACKAALCPWTETVLYRFTGGSDGGFGGGAPSYADALVFDQAGNIYGTTPNDGAFGNGVVFKLTQSGGSWTESVLWSFTGGNDGANPFSGVIFDNAGNLYGTAAFGGANNQGVVYELSPSESGWTQSTLYSFRSEDSSYPYGGVTMDAQGNLYGTTGGPQGDGEAYELAQANGNWIVSRRQVFFAYEGPYDTPTLDAEGNLYGTVCLGGNGDGEVFKLTPTGSRWTYTNLYNFTGEINNGYAPVGGVIFDANGNLYGTTYAGGENGDGIVWKITP
ncbi:MAG: choice-of-anchor tandem repeat GloVer-containing protein [Candidatus Korobacteraceae bacterium]